MKKIYLVISISVFLCSVYIGLWVYSSKYFAQEIDRIYTSSSNKNITFLGEKPHLSNFPFVPEVTYTKGIQSGNIKILFPQIIIRGYPLPFSTLNLSFPEGVSVSSNMLNPEIWNLSFLDIDLAVPYHLPKSFYEEDLNQWKNNGGKIDIRKYIAQKNQLKTVGMGNLFLDDNLQPNFNFLSVINGYEDFIQNEKNHGRIDPLGAALGMTILNGLSKTDEETGEKAVTLNISVKNQMLSVGPIQALPLPMIVWDKRNSPVPRQ